MKFAFAGFRHGHIVAMYQHVFENDLLEIVACCEEDIAMRDEVKAAAQMMLTMNNGCGVLGDVSYSVPDSLGYGHSLYWRFTLWGSKGVLETAASAEGVSIALAGEKEFVVESLPKGESGGYLRDFLDDVAGNPKPGSLETKSILKAQRFTLEIQAMADEA
ncbi:MAG: hypothetical protein GXP32_10610 [Kiritimatiellaeota bacterium]|nr:hypothetical protein [Kiritimatiellota bacterium]